MKNIEIDEWYTPTEIARMNVMTANSIDTRRQMVLRYIREGQIKAKHIGKGRGIRYLIRGFDLKEFLKNHGK